LSGIRQHAKEPISLRTDIELVADNVVSAHDSIANTEGSAKKTVARPERFELPTFWFVARRSIQLSYGRTVQKSLA
jgi:hypothetical protein